MQQQGVTLIQLLYALMLITLLLHLGIPAYSDMSTRLQRQASAQQLTQALNHARSEALQRNQIVVLQAIEGDWRNGWRTVLEQETRTLLHEYRASGRVLIVGNQPLAHHVRFSGLGTPLQGSGAFLAGTLHVCEDATARSHYQVVLSRSGRVSLRQALHEQPLCAAAGSGQRTHP